MVDVFPLPMQASHNTFLPDNAKCTNSCCSLDKSFSVIAKFSLTNKMPRQHPIQKPPGHNSYLIRVIISDSHRCARQNYGKAVTKTRHMGLVPLLNRKCQKSTALPKYVILCIFLSFIVNSCLLFSTKCAIIITEDDIIIQQMTHLKGAHHDFC